MFPSAFCAALKDGIANNQNLNFEKKFFGFKPVMAIYIKFSLYFV